MWAAFWASIPNYPRVITPPSSSAPFETARQGSKPGAHSRSSRVAPFGLGSRPPNKLPQATALTSRFPSAAPGHRHCPSAAGFECLAALGCGMFGACRSLEPSRSPTPRPCVALRPKHANGWAASRVASWPSTSRAMSSVRIPREKSSVCSLAPAIAAITRLAARTAAHRIGVLSVGPPARSIGTNLR